MTDEAWIDTVRLARDFGTVSELFPPEFTDLRDLPHPLFDEIRTAMSFLSFEELPEDEQPPHRIWDDREKLSEWFDDVKIARKQRYGSGSSPSDQAIEDPVDNQAGADLKRTLGIS